MNLERKSFDVEIKAVNDDGSFTAYFAAFGNIDRVDDIIEPGAFRNLDTFTKDGWVGISHDMESLPIAYVVSATQDGYGLKIEGRFHSTPEAQSCRSVVKERLAAGKSVKGSIGYLVPPGGSVQDYQGGKPVRRIKQLDVFECSFVNLPANPAAEAISAKGATVQDKVLTLDALKAWIEHESKAGRVLSRANHDQLKKWHAALADCCSGIKAMIDTHDPDGEPDGDEADKAVLQKPGPNPKGTISAGDGATSPEQQLAAGKAADQLRASIVRARLKSLHLSV
jgi:uncharacterized protein